MPVITGAAEYPEDIYGRLAADGKKYISVPALELAETAGTSKAVNTVLIGALAKITGEALETVEEALKRTVKPKLLDVNLAALKAGYDFIK